MSQRGKYEPTIVSLQRQAFLEMAWSDLAGPESVSTFAFLCYMEYKNNCHELGREYNINLQPNVSFGEYIKE